MRKFKYPEGSLLFNVTYHYKPECFEVVYLDPITNQLEVVYEEAIIDIWFLKEEHRTQDYQLAQVEMDKCYPVYCKPSQVSKAIADNIGGEYAEYFNTYSKQIKPHDLKRKMCECPYVFKADLQPDVYFRLDWKRDFNDEFDVSKVTYGVLDIEVDVIDRTLNMKDIHNAPQPINAVSIILPHVKIAALLVLGPRPKHALHEKFHKLLEKQEEQHQWLLNNIGEFKRQMVEEDPDNKKYIGDYDIRIHTFDFNEEIYLIKTVFDYINKYRPMFVMSWNAIFDHNYLPNRISYLGYNPLDIIIPEEFKVKKLYYAEDKNPRSTLKTTKDWLHSSTYSIYICQMRLFVQTRKSQQERRSNSLSAIGKAMAKIDKLGDKKEGTFRQWAYLDWITFLLYNMRDSVVQVAIEEICNDCKALVSRNDMFLTYYAKCFQETHICRNIREYYWEKNGLIQACRLIIPPGIDPAFKGAFVAEPKNNAPTGYVLNGKPINNIIYGILDADAKSYYPSTKMGLNLDPMTLIYKCDIDNSLFTSKQCINKSFNQEYLWSDTKGNQHKEDLTGPLFNSYKNGNICSVMTNWFNVPSIPEYFQYLDSKLS